MENEEVEEDSEIEETESNEESGKDEEKQEKGFFGKLKEKFIGESKKEIEEQEEVEVKEEPENSEDSEEEETEEEKETDDKEPGDSEEDESEIEKTDEEEKEESTEELEEELVKKEEELAEEESGNSEEAEDSEEAEETEEVEKEELEEEKDLIKHAAESVEHITSETAKEIDESKEVENMKKVEAALFIAGRFLTLQELVMLTDVNPLMLKEILEKLTEEYNDNSGIEIIEKGGCWKMDVCKEHVHMINKLATGNSEFTKAEQETLAVIAYKQPVKQSVIINIRGNKAYDHIKKFIENELVVGKRVGHTKELRLSDDFYEYFHIRDKKVERNGDDKGNEADNNLVIPKEQNKDISNNEEDIKNKKNENIDKKDSVKETEKTEE